MIATGLLERAICAVARRLAPAPTPVNRFAVDACAASERREAAMSLMDDDTRGYVLLRIAGDGESGRVLLDIEVDPDHWPAVALSLARLHDEATRMLR